MKLHEIDFESGREFKRDGAGKHKMMNKVLMHKTPWDESWVKAWLALDDFRADDWEYCDEIAEAQWYKHEYAQKCYEKMFNLNHMITTKIWEKFSDCNSYIPLNVDQKIEKPEWAK